MMFSLTFALIGANNFPLPPNYPKNAAPPPPPPSRLIGANPMRSDLASLMDNRRCRALVNRRSAVALRENYASLVRSRLGSVSFLEGGSGRWLRHFAGCSKMNTRSDRTFGSAENLPLRVCVNRRQWIGLLLCNNNSNFLASRLSE